MFFLLLLLWKLLCNSWGFNLKSRVLSFFYNIKKYKPIPGPAAQSAKTNPQQ